MENVNQENGAQVPFQRTKLNEAISSHEVNGPTISETQRVLDEQAEMLAQEQSLPSSKQNRSKIEGLIEMIRSFVVRLVNAVRRLFALPPLNNAEMAPNSEPSRFSFDAPASKANEVAPTDYFINEKLNDAAPGEHELEHDDEGPVSPEFSFVSPSSAVAGNESDTVNETQSQYSLFDPNSSVSSTLSEQPDGSLKVTSNYVGELDSDAKSVMQNALSRLDHLLNKVLDNPKVVYSDTSPVHLIDTADVAEIHISLDLCEQALVGDLLSELERGGAAHGDAGNSQGAAALRTAVEAIVTGLPRAAEDTIKTTLRDSQQQDKVRKYLRDNSDLVESYLVNRSTVRALHHFNPPPTMGQKEVQQQAKVALEQAQSIGSQTLSVGRVSAEDLLELEQNSDIELDEQGAIRTAVRPRG